MTCFSSASLLSNCQIYILFFVCIFKNLLVTQYYVAIRFTNLSQTYTPALDRTGSICTKLLDKMGLEAGIRRENDGTFQAFLLRRRVRKLDGENSSHAKRMLQDWFQPCQNMLSYLMLIFLQAFSLAHILLARRILNIRSMGWGTFILFQ